MVSQCLCVRLQHFFNVSLIINEKLTQNPRMIWSVCLTTLLMNDDNITNMMVREKARA